MYGGKKDAMGRDRQAADPQIARTTRGAASDAAARFGQDRPALPRHGGTEGRPLRFEASPDRALWNMQTSGGGHIALRVLTGEGLYALWPLALS